MKMYKKRMTPALVLLLAAPAAWAQTQQIEVQGRHYDNAVGSSDAASQGSITAELLKSRPALRPGEVLEFVPGLIVTQHSGDGKANQYFLRGFNLDHGTDFATTVAGMPVNMPTHGHGQGYTDLNFLIPELVQRIDYRKGPYFATHGDFASAGAADIVYRTRLDAPFGQFTLGENGYRRGVAAGSFKLGGGLQLLAAGEAMANDGPWTVPEGLQRRNAVLTLSGGDASQGFSATLMGYRARWTSTDQIPQRLIDSGALGRFDSLDPSDGGRTTRSSLSGEWHRNDGRLADPPVGLRHALFAGAVQQLHLCAGTAGAGRPVRAEGRSQRARPAGQPCGRPQPGRPAGAQRGGVAAAA
jgi:outer membrane cobalamin receptor